MNINNNLLKFVRYEINNNISFGVLYNDIYIIPKDDILTLRSFPTLDKVIKKLTEQEADEVIDYCSTVKNPKGLIETSSVTLLSPIDKVPHDIICLGLNYTDHIKEMAKNIAIDTVYFSKRATFFNGTNSDIKYDFSLDSSFDYEVELAVVIGKGGKNIKKEDAEKHIFGYTILNDLTDRKLQKSVSQWYRGKSLDNLLSIGPCLVYKKNLPLPLELDIKSFINDEVRQHSNTKYMIKDVATTIEEISLDLTLEPGDIISTGTPSGVGDGFTPPKYLKSGDKVECYIEKIGSLTNKVV